MRIISLSSGNLICKIAPEMGGSIYSFNHIANGISQPLLRSTPGLDSHLITDFACWPLVPYSNRINKGKFRFNGNDYRVPITWLGPPHHASHGQGWEHIWDVKSHSITNCKINFSFDHKSYWPFPYAAEQYFKLDDKGLNIEISLTNTGTDSMPAGLGLHPYFPRTAGTTLKAIVGHLWEIDNCTIPVQRIAVPEKYNFSAPKSLDNLRLDNCFDGYGGRMEITWPGQSMKLHITSSENLRHFVVYTPEGKDFFCAEPVSHRPDAINHMDEEGHGLVILHPGEKMKASYRFEMVVA